MNDRMTAAHLRFVSATVALRLAAVLVTWACLLPLPARAQSTVTWDGGDMTWTQPDSTSWGGATYVSGDTAVFAGSGTGTVTIDAGGVTPGQTNVTSGSYTFSGGPLGGSGGIAKSGTGTLTLTGSNSYTGTTSITAGVLNIQHASALGGTAAGTTVASGAALQIQGGITVTDESLSLSGGGITSSGALRNISGTNTWTGGIGIDGVGTIAANGDVPGHTRIGSDAGSLALSGPVQIAAPAAAGSASAVLVQGGGNVEISGNISGGKAGNVSFVSSGNGSGTRTLSGSNSYLGWTIVNGNLTLNGGSAIPDTSRVVSENSNGRLVLNASETIGGLASNAAGFQINLNAHTLTIGADNTTPLASNVGGAVYLGTIIGTGGIEKVGSGTLTLSSSNSYSGGTTVSAGELLVDNAAALGATSGDLVVNGGTLRLNGVSVTVGPLSGSAGGTITTNTTSGTATLTTSASSSSTFAGTIADNGSGRVALVKSGTGMLTLSGSNSYSGTTSITGGALNIQNASALGGTVAGATVASGAALQIQGGITVTGKSLSLSGNGIAGDGALRSISGSNAWTGAIGIDGVGALAASGLNTLYNRIGSDSGSSLTLSGPIEIASPAATGSGSTVLVQGDGDAEISGNISGGKADMVSFLSSSNGTGVRTLSGSNSYLGWTAVHGNLTLNGGSAIPDTSRVVSESAVGRLVLNANETIGGLASSTTGMQINLNSNTLTIGADNATPLASNVGGATYLGTIIGTGGIVKVGTGGLTFSNANTYSGPTTISGGTLALDALGTVANTPTITIGDAGSSGAVLDISAKTGTFTFAGSQTVGGIGTLKVGDTAAFAGTFAPGNSAGVFTLDGGTTLLSGTTEIEILGSARGTSYDAVDLVNSAVLDYGDGVLALDFGSSLAAVQSYQLFGNGSQSLIGGFLDLTIVGTNYSTLDFTESSPGVWTSTGTSPANQTLTFTEATGTLVIVPEPGVLALAGIGGAIAAWAVRRRS